jgi:hypothetical protein
VGGLGVGGGLVAVADVLGQVLGEVADAPPGVLGTGQHALGVEPVPEPGDMQRLVLLADRIERFIPAGQDLAGGRVEIGPGVLVPDRQVPAVKLDGRGGGPPDLVVGRGDDLA